MPIELVQIDQQNMARVWPRLLPFIENIAAHMRDKYTVDDLFTCAVLNKKQVWIAYQVENDNIMALALTEINQFPNNRVCHVVACTGHDMEKWEELILKIEQWAAHNKCTDMELIARPGWERGMKKFGYEKTHVVLNKFLKENLHGE